MSTLARWALFVRSTYHRHYAAYMRHDPDLWRELAVALRTARGQRTLASIGLEVSSLSRVENNERTPKREQVEAYGAVTKNPNLLELFDRIDARVNGPRDTDGTPVAHTVEVDTIIELGRTMMMSERQTIEAVKGSVDSITIQTPLSTRDGRRGHVLSVQSFRAAITSRTFESTRLEKITLALPRAITQQSGPYDIIVRHELGSDTMPHVLWDVDSPMRRIRASIKFDSEHYEAFSVDRPSGTTTSDFVTGIIDRDLSIDPLPMSPDKEVDVDFRGPTVGRTYGIVWRRGN